MRDRGGGGVSEVVGLAGCRAVAGEFDGRVDHVRDVCLCARIRVWAGTYLPTIQNFFFLIEL